MKKATIILMLFWFGFNLTAQNLVKNSGFENYSQCPPDIGWGFNSYINYAYSWDYSIFTPDFFHTCASGNAAVPNNWMGNQLAATDSGYAGFLAYQSGILNGREGIITMLSDTLQPGKTYYCSFKLSLAEISTWGCNNMGMLFTTKFHQLTPSAQTQYSQVNRSQFYTSSIISDTTNWTTVSGCFVADSSYLYLSISNHFDDVYTNIDTNNSTPPAGIGYYYIDDVCVSLTPNTCGFNGVGCYFQDELNDTIIPIAATIDTIVNGLNLTNKEITLKVYPNPSSDIVYMDLKSKRKQVLVKIYSLSGQLIKQSKAEDIEHIKIELGEIQSGIYLMKIRIDGVSIDRKLLVK